MIALPLCLALAAVQAPSLAAPQRVLLLLDQTRPNAALWHAYNHVADTIAADPALELIEMETYEEAAVRPMRRAAAQQVAIGRRQFEALELRDACRRLGSATQKLQRVATHTGHVAPLCDALALLGAAQLLLKDAGATYTLRHLLTLCPQHQPQRQHYNPAMVAALLGVGQDLKRQPPAQLHLRAPAHSVVYLDDVPLGVGRLDKPLPVAAGTHYLTVLTPGAAPNATSFYAASGQHVHCDLQTSPSALSAAACDHRAALLAAAASPSGFPDPQNALLRAVGADRVSVVSSDPDGAPCVTHFNLHRGIRHRASTSADNKELAASLANRS